MNALDHVAAVRAAVTNLEAARRNVADEAQTWRRTDRVAIWDEDAHQDATARLRDSVDRLTDAFHAYLAATRAPVGRMVTKLGPEYGDMFDREIGGLVENELDVIRAEDLVEVFDLPGRAEDEAAEIRAKRRAGLAEMTRQAQADGAYDDTTSMADIVQAIDEIRAERRGVTVTVTGGALSPEAIADVKRYGGAL